MFTGKHLYQGLFLSFKFILKEALAQGCSCESCKIFKNNFFMEKLWMTASGKTSSFQNLKFQNSSSYFWLHLRSPSTLWQIVLKRSIHRKYVWWCPFIFHSALKLFSEWFECSEHVSIYNFYKKKIVWQFDVESHVTQDLGDTCLKVKVLM